MYLCDYCLYCLLCICDFPIQFDIWTAILSSVFILLTEIQYAWKEPNFKKCTLSKWWRTKHWMVEIGWAMRFLVYSMHEKVIISFSHTRVCSAKTTALKKANVSTLPISLFFYFIWLQTFVRARRQHGINFSAGLNHKKEEEIEKSAGKSECACERKRTYTHTLAARKMSQEIKTPSIVNLIQWTLCVHARIPLYLSIVWHIVY